MVYFRRSRNNGLEYPRNWMMIPYVEREDSGNGLVMTVMECPGRQPVYEDLFGGY